MLEIRATDRDGEKKANFHVLGFKQQMYAKLILNLNLIKVVLLLKLL